MNIANIAPDLFRTAALGLIPWDIALGELTDALDCSLAQFAGVDRHENLAFNVLTAGSDTTISRGSRGSTGTMLEDYFAADGHLPGANPRTRAHQYATPGRCLTDADFISPDRIARHPIYQGLFRRYDATHTVLLRLPTPEAPDSLRAGLSLFWSDRRGPPSADTLRLLETIAPAIGSATTLAAQIEGRRHTSLVDTVERLAGPTFLLRADRLVIALSPSAQHIARTSPALTVRDGRLAGRSAEMEARLADGCGRALLPGPDMPGAATLILRSPDGAGGWIADITRLPMRDPTALVQGALLVTLRRIDAPSPLDETLLMAAYGLTVAEAAVAALVADGHDPAAIAIRRQVSIGTVRAHLKAIFGKTGTRRQIELSLALAPYRVPVRTMAG